MSNAAGRELELEIAGGCGCKLPKVELDRLLAGIGSSASALADGTVLLDHNSRADVGAVQLDADRVLVTSVDFGTPVSRDAEIWGRVAVQNALSDVYAVGARPAYALNILTWPATSDESIAAKVLSGGAQTLRESGTVLLGGHTVRADQAVFGAAVFGFAQTAELMRLDRASPGDVLVLSKPLGVGVCLAAQQAGTATDTYAHLCEQLMLESNRTVSNLAVRHRVRAATDVTGFGLVGHLGQLAAASGIEAVLHVDSVPLLEGSLDHVSLGVIPTAAERTLVDSEFVEWGSTSIEQRLLLCDPQSSGGLLLAVNASELDGLLDDAAAADAEIWQVGEIVDGVPGRVKASSTTRRQ